jgi:hypothetical protein
MENKVPRFKINLDGVESKQSKEIKKMLTPSKRKILKGETFMFVKDRRTKTGLRLKELIKD